MAAAGRSTRSIAKKVGVQPRIVSLWRHRFADHGLEGLKDKPRPGKEPIYTKSTDKRIVALLDKPPPKGFARWTGPLLAESLDDVDVQYVWRFLRSHQIDLHARKMPMAPRLMVVRWAHQMRGPDDVYDGKVTRAAKRLEHTALGFT